VFLNDLSAASVSSPIETKGPALTTGIYTVSAAAISNGVLGNISSYRFAVCPQVTGIKWGSTSTADDHALATSNTIFISFTKPTTDTRFTYALYSTTGTTSPAGWVGSPDSGVFVGSTSGNDFTVTLSTPGLKNFFVSTLFDNRPAGTYFLSAGSPLVSFTYGFSNYFSQGSTEFNVPRANTFAIMFALGGGGAGAGYGYGSCCGGGAGGYAETRGYREIQSGDTIIIDGPGKGGKAGVAGNLNLTGTGGLGGARAGGFSTPGSTDGTGASITPLEGSGGGGGNRYFIGGLLPVVNGLGGGGGANSKLALQRNGRDYVLLVGGGGAGGGGYDGGGSQLFYGGDGGTFNTTFLPAASGSTHPENSSRVGGYPGGAKGGTTNTAGGIGEAGYYQPDRWNGGAGGVPPADSGTVAGKGGNGGSQPAPSVQAGTGTDGADGFVQVSIYYVIPPA
jgi:hypothetical protein